MREDQVASTVSLLKQVAFALKKLAECASPTPVEQPETPATTEFSLDVDTLRKMANEECS